MSRSGFGWKMMGGNGDYDLKTGRFMPVLVVLNRSGIRTGYARRGVNSVLALFCGIV